MDKLLICFLLTVSFTQVFSGNFLLSSNLANSSALAYVIYNVMQQLQICQQQVYFCKSQVMRQIQRVRCVITYVISAMFIDPFISSSLLNPFSPCSFLITLKTSENLWFSDVFARDQKKTFGRKGLTMELSAQPFIRQFFKTNWFPLARVQFLIYTCMMRASKVFRLLGSFLFYLLTRTSDYQIE